MVMPNLFIPGAAKAGTSSLHEYLNQHPDIFMSPFKEPQFFSHDKPLWGKVGYNDGIATYKQYFAGAEGHKIVGESSTSYMLFPKVIERIKKHISNPKFIFIFRNPVSRAYSHYTWMLSHHAEKKGFRQVFIDDMDVLIDSERNHDKVGRYRYYYQNGLYATWLQKFQENFGKENIHVITLECLKTDELDILNSCFRFLQINELESITSVQSNQTVRTKYEVLFYPLSWFWNNIPLKRVLEKKHMNVLKERIKSNFLEKYPKLSLEDRIWVASFYREEVERLREITGLELLEWRADFPN